ncbi:MAG: NAD(P)/FAD-dependent oxidoreductase [Nitrososphaera sp.]
MNYWDSILKTNVYEAWEFMEKTIDSVDMVAIGGGLAGLATAALVARSGKSVALYEQSSNEIGGRARTLVHDGYFFNQGPHALFLADAGARLLQELEISYTGGIPSATSFEIRDVKNHRLLVNGSSDSTTQASESGPGKVFAQLTGLLNKSDFAELESVSVQEWIDRNFHDSDSIELMKALIRLTTYANDPDIQSAGSALHQFHVYNQGGVMYLDRGWQTLVAGLVEAAKNAGARIDVGKKASKVQKSGSGWLVALSDNSQISAKVLVIAVGGPHEAEALFREGEKPEALSKAVNESKPVRMVCLDVALSSLPQKDMMFALGIDSPLYFSVHSASAELAPPNGALIHVAKYLGTSIKPNPREDGKELEELLDLLQPGWREVVVKKRPLPSMVVTNALPVASSGGLSGRPAPRIDDGLYIVGDWVGSEGLLSNASLASARRAAQEIQNELASDYGVSGQKSSISDSVAS